MQPNIAGFVTELGGPLSHTAILARSLGIPAIVGIQGARSLLHQEEQIIIDGTNGMVLAGADQKTVKTYQQRQRKEKEARRKLRALRGVSARTRDGTRISLQANIELAEDMIVLRQSGADGVGLYRTEFLYIDRETPADEDEQLNAYRKIIRVLKGKPDLRTLDLLRKRNLSKFPRDYQNPALGLRGLAIQDLDHSCVQLRASSSGPVRILLPMKLHSELAIIWPIPETIQGRTGRQHVHL